MKKQYAIEMKSGNTTCYMRGSGIVTDLQSAELFERTTALMKVAGINLKPSEWTYTVIGPVVHDKIR